MGTINFKITCKTPELNLYFFQFQASIDNIDDIDLEVEDDLEFDSGRRFGRVAFDNSVFDTDA